MAQNNIQKNNTQNSSATNSPQLTPRQEAIMGSLEKFVEENGYSPSMRELAKLVGLKSTASVQYHLEKLEDYGCIFKGDDRHRSIRLLKGSEPEDSPAPEAALVPLVGSIAAGAGMIAEEQIEELFPLPPQLAGKGKLFALRVEGDSMKDAAILDRDWVILRSQNVAENGDIVAVGIGSEEATLKHFYKRGDQVVLEPANEAYEPICLDAHSIDEGSTIIYGKVISVLRRL